MSLDRPQAPLNDVGIVAHNLGIMEQERKGTEDSSAFPKDLDLSLVDEHGDQQTLQDDRHIKERDLSQECKSVDP